MLYRQWRGRNRTAGSAPNDAVCMPASTHMARREEGKAAGHPALAALLFVPQFSQMGSTSVASSEAPFRFSPKLSRETKRPIFMRASAGRGACYNGIMPWHRTDLKKQRPPPIMRTMLVIFIVLAVVIAGWLFGAVLMSGYLLH